MSEYFSCLRLAAASAAEPAHDALLLTEAATPKHLRQNIQVSDDMLSCKNKLCKSPLGVFKISIWRYLVTAAILTNNSNHNLYNHNISVKISVTHGRWKKRLDFDMKKTADRWANMYLLLRLTTSLLNKNKLMQQHVHYNLTQYSLNNVIVLNCNCLPGCVVSACSIGVFWKRLD